MYKKYLFVILALIGLCISVYLTLEAHNPANVVCSLGGCAKVLSSKYATIFGIPVSGYGIFWYITTLLFTWFALFERRINKLYFTLWLLVGLVFSLYLLSLEVFVIHYYCLWCLGSLTIVILLNFFNFANLGEVKK